MHKAKRRKDELRACLSFITFGLIVALSLSPTLTIALIYGPFVGREPASQAVDEAEKYREQVKAR